MAVPNIFGSATSAIPLSQLDTNFATPVTIGNTAVQLGNTVTSFGNVTLTNVTVSSGNVTITGANVSGNLAFTGTGNRITGDFSNATVANRVAFQTSTVNSATDILILPNGTNNVSALSVSGNSDPTNASTGIFGIFSDALRVYSNRNGTGTYLPMTFYTGGAEAMRITNAGATALFGFGTSSPAVKLDINGITAWQGGTTGQTAQIVGASSGLNGGSNLRVLSNTTQAVDVGGSISLGGYYNGVAQSIDYAQIIGAKENSTSGNAAGYLVLGTRPAGGNMAERMRIDSSGNLLLNNTTLDIQANMLYWNRGGGTTGHLAVGNTEATDVTALIYCNRQGSDGALVEFRQANATEGKISVSGTTVTYGGGHLARFGQLPDGSEDPTLLKGTVLTNLDEMCVWINKETGIPADNEQCNKVKISDVDGDANVAGVFVSWSYDEQHDTNDLFVAMTGDMIIRIAQGVTVARGDLLMSAGDGTAKPQGDDIVRSKTVAKVTSNHVTCTYADGSYCVPCVLMAC